MPSEQNIPSIFSTFLSVLRSVGFGLVFMIGFGMVWHVSQPVAHAQAVQSEHVIFISVDGLRSDALTSLGPNNLPAFYKLMNEGSYTLNARNDPDYTITLPNHTSMLTGRFVSGSAGHNWTKNTDPNPGETIHTSAGRYIPSVFDVFHDEGMKTGLFATKSKFEVFFTSWDATNGAPDTAFPDFGRSKIDATGFESSSMDVVQAFIDASSSGAFNFSFLHLYDPDHVGHVSGWDTQLGSMYSLAVMEANAAIADLLSFVESSPMYSGKTTIILTADHGGVDFGHSDPFQVLNYTIPFMVWGEGVTPATDLYALNPDSRQDPGLNHIARSFSGTPPIRNADGANLALSLLGLPPIPGSTINTKQDLSLGATASTGTVVNVAFQDGAAPTTSYDGTRDTKIISVLPQQVFGSDPVLEVDSEPDYGVLVSWDLTSIPTNASVTEATLVLDVTNVTGLDYEYYAVNRWWEEEFASWVRANNEQNWQVPGALGELDHAASSLGSVTASTTGTFRFTFGNAALAQVQQWISDPGSNYGLIFQDYTSGDDGLDFSSRENPDPTKLPRLEISYSLESTTRDPQAPTAAFDMTLSRSAGGTNFAGDASASTDANGVIVGYAWDFGDGAKSNGALASHTYASPGVYSVTLTVTDDSGETNHLSRFVHVGSVGENQVVFQDGIQPAPMYKGTRDTKILSGAPSSNFGFIDFLETDGSPQDVSLVRWDISAIAPGVTVTDVKLIFNVVDASNENYGVFGAAKPWNEQESTWELAQANTPWSSLGASGASDFMPSRLGNAGPSPLGTHAVSLNAAGIALVESWIDNPSSNYGFIIRDYAGSQDGLDFASREAVLPSQRPCLEIVFTDQEVVVIDPDTTSSAAPVALFDMVLTRDVGQIKASLDATSSTSSSILTYEWAFSNGGTATGLAVNHAFEKVGAHTVTLTVTDSSGATSTLVRPVIVDVHGENAFGFQDGVSPVAPYAGTRDTKILSGAKTANYGSDATLETDGSPQNVSLLQWDLAAIAPGVDVLEVTLHLEVTDPTTEDYGLFGLAHRWEESASTWMEAAKGYAWQVDGAAGENDFLPAVLADLGPAALGPLSVTLNQEGLDLVESWINNPSTNHGFILRDYTNSQDGLDIASRESTVEAVRPRIQIRYQSQHHAELPEKLTIGAYPNPFGDELWINLASPIVHDVQLELFDMLGRRVTNHVLGAGEISGPILLRTSSLTAGVYALRVTEHGSIVSTTQLVTKGY
jgi:PKD repeat protein